MLIMWLLSTVNIVEKFDCHVLPYNTDLCVELEKWVDYLSFYYTAEDQEGVMDNLLEALKNGSAFNVNRERKDGRKRTPRAAGG